MAKRYGRATDGTFVAFERPDIEDRVGCGDPSPLGDGGCQRAFGHAGDHTHWHPNGRGGSGSWAQRRERAKP